MSILANGPDSFAGRKLGVLISDGASAAALKGLRSALKAEGGVLELVAPVISGVTLDDGSTEVADQIVEGGPSVLYDAVAILVSEAGATALSAVPAAKQFLADAHAHCKFIAHTPEAATLFAAAGVSPDAGGYVQLGGRGGPKRFVEACRALRIWDRAV